MKLVAPSLFQYEIVASLRKHIYRGNLSPKEANEAFEFVSEQKIIFYLERGLLQRALELANQFGHPTAYDAQYLAVAEYLSCDFWTGDRQLFMTTSPTYAWVKWLGNF